MMIRVPTTETRVLGVRGRVRATQRNSCTHVELWCIRHFRTTTVSRTVYTSQVECLHFFAGCNCDTSRNRR